MTDECVTEGVDALQVGDRRPRSARSGEDGVEAQENLAGTEVNGRQVGLEKRLAEATELIGTVPSQHGRSGDRSPRTGTYSSSRGTYE